MKFNWNPDLYDSKHNFVFKFGEEIVKLLNPQKNETILDIGSGTGDLTKKIAELSEKEMAVIKKQWGSNYLQIIKKIKQLKQSRNKILKNKINH